MKKFIDTMKEKINFRPLLFVAIVFSLGIVFSLKWGTPIIILIAFILALALFIISLIFKKRGKDNRLTKILSLFLAVFALAVYITCINIEMKDGSFIGEGCVMARVVDTVEVKGGYEIYVSKVFVDGERFLGKGMFKSESPLEKGSHVEFFAQMKEIDVINYTYYEEKDVLERRLNNFKIYDDYEIELIPQSSIQVRAGSQNTFEKIKECAYMQMTKFMDEDMASVSFGMMFGDTRYISEKVDNNFDMTGLSHIFAVSGLHVGIFFLFISKIFKLIKGRREIGQILSVFLSIIYVSICGFSPSTIRALVMIVVSVILSNLYIYEDKLSTLACAFIIVLCLNCFDLFTVGFQLSFIAMFSIIVMSPFVANPLSNNKIKATFYHSTSIFALSIPVVSHCFGYIALLSPFVNVLFLPILTFCYVYNLVFLPLSALFQFNFCIVSNFALGVVIGIIDLLNNFLSGVIYYRMTQLSVILTYSIVIILTPLINFEKSTRKTMLIILAIVLIMTFFI